MTTSELRKFIEALKIAKNMENKCLNIDEESTKSIYFSCKEEMKQVISIIQKKNSLKEQFGYLIGETNEAFERLRKSVDNENTTIEKKIAVTAIESSKFNEKIHELNNIQLKLAKLEEESDKIRAVEKYALKGEWKDIETMYSDYTEDVQKKENINDVSGENIKVSGNLDDLSIGSITPKEADSLMSMLDKEVLDVGELNRNKEEEKEEEEEEEEKERKGFFSILKRKK